MALPRKAEVKERKPPCTVCGKESAISMEAAGHLCAGCDVDWCRHVDKLVDDGAWPTHRWLTVWEPWLASRRKRSAA